MNIFRLLYLAQRSLSRKIKSFFNHIKTYCLLKGNGAKFSSFKTGGVPYIMVARYGQLEIGKNFSINSGIDYNPIGCPQKSTLFVHNNCIIKIGNNVGISQTALISHSSITIEDNVKIGGGVCVYTTDFHSLDPILRAGKDDLKNRKTAPVIIQKNAFIGAHSIILKGVTIGENSIVGAGSVVSKSIPANQIWAGNPAKFIRNI